MSTKVIDKADWEKFVMGDLINFMEANGLEKISVDNGAGSKANLKKTKDGEWKIKIVDERTV